MLFLAQLKIASSSSQFIRCINHSILLTPDRPDIIRAEYEANFIGPIRVMQTVIPFFRHRKSGTIINIGSAVSYSGMPGNTIYGSTKAAMRSMYLLPSEMPIQFD